MRTVTLLQRLIRALSGSGVLEVHGRHAPFFRVPSSTMGRGGSFEGPPKIPPLAPSRSSVLPQGPALALTRCTKPGAVVSRKALMYTSLLGHLGGCGTTSRQYRPGKCVLPNIPYGLHLFVANVFPCTNLFPCTKSGKSCKSSAVHTCPSPFPSAVTETTHLHPHPICGLEHRPHWVGAWTQDENQRSGAGRVVEARVQVENRGLDEAISHL